MLGLFEFHIFNPILHTTNFGELILIWNINLNNHLTCWRQRLIKLDRYLSSRCFLTLHLLVLFYYLLLLFLDVFILNLFHNNWHYLFLWFWWFFRILNWGILALNHLRLQSVLNLSVELCHGLNRPLHWLVILFNFCNCTRPLHLLIFHDFISLFQRILFWSILPSI